MKILVPIIKLEFSHLTGITMHVWLLLLKKYAKQQEQNFCLTLTSRLMNRPMGKVFWNYAQEIREKLGNWTIPAIKLQIFFYKNSKNKEIEFIEISFWRYNHRSCFQVWVQNLSLCSKNFNRFWRCKLQILKVKRLI